MEKTQFLRLLPHIQEWKDPPTGCLGKWFSASEIPPHMALLHIKQVRFGIAVCIRIYHLFLLFTAVTAATHEQTASSATEESIWSAASQPVSR